MPSYLVHNAVHAQHTRTQRSAAAVHPRLKQHFGDAQFRVLRGRPVLLTEEQFLKHLPELQQKVAQGVLSVTTADHRMVDMNTLAAMAPAPVTPLPKPRLDSIANDDSWGQVIPPQVDGLAAMVDETGAQKMPLLVATAPSDAAEEPGEVAPTDDGPGDAFDMEPSDEAVDTAAETVPAVFGQPSAPQGGRKRGRR